MLKPNHRIVFFAGLLCASCGPLSLSRLDLRSDDESDVNTLSTSSETAGIETAALSANSGGRITSNNSSLFGANLEIAAGSLSIGTTISVEEGDAITGDSDISDLGINDSNPIRSAGTTVVFESSESVNASSPMSLQIPAPTSTLGLAGGYLVVLAKVKKAGEAGFYLKVIKDVELRRSLVVFSSSYFGAFQAVLVAAEIPEAKEIPAQVPILQKVARDDLSGTWVSKCIRDGSDEDSNYERQEMYFSGKQMGLRSGQYDHAVPDCGKSLLQFALQGEYVSQALTTTTEIRGIDISIKFMGIKPVTIEIANMLNDKAFCGKSNWTAGVTIDVSADFGKDGCGFEKGSTCDVDHRLSVGKTIYQIYSTADSVLRIGDDGSGKTKDDDCAQYGNTETNRPKALEDISRALNKK